MLDITAVILTKNEQLNLPDCLRSIAGHVRRVLVVDSGSDDDTVAIAEKMGAEVLVHPFENYARQFNWALENGHIETAWTLRLDADERIPEVLWQELERLTQQHEKDDVNGITMEAWLCFMGKKIRFGCHNKRKLMLFRTGLASIEDRRMDEHTVLHRGTSVRAKKRFIHDDQKDLSHWIHKLNWYATREMQDYFEFKAGKSTGIPGNHRTVANQRKKKFGLYYRMPMFFRCWLLFIYNYIFRLGFLDGKAGFIYNWMYHRWYRSLVDAKIWEQKRTGKAFEETGDLK